MQQAAYRCGQNRFERVGAQVAPEIEKQQVVADDEQRCGRRRSRDPVDVAVASVDPAQTGIGFRGKGGKQDATAQLHELRGVGVHLTLPSHMSVADIEAVPEMLANSSRAPGADAEHSADGTAWRHRLDRIRLAYRLWIVHSQLLQHSWKSPDLLALEIRAIHIEWPDGVAHAVIVEIAVDRNSTLRRKQRIAPEIVVAAIEMSSCRRVEIEAVEVAERLREQRAFAPALRLTLHHSLSALTVHIERFARGKAAIAQANRLSLLRIAPVVDQQVTHDR